MTMEALAERDADGADRMEQGRDLFEASHFDKQTAYAAVDRHRLEDYKAYLYRTHDGGKSWQIVTEDPRRRISQRGARRPARKGLLYAGTETGIYVSFDDGDHWQPLQFNLPVASVRDINVMGRRYRRRHPRSSVLGARRHHLAPRGQPKSSSTEDVHFYKPQVATRTRPGGEEATPYPKEIPHGDNPATGAVFDYYLRSGASSPITLEIFNAKGESVRKFSSDKNPPAPDEKNLRVERMGKIRHAVADCGRASFRVEHAGRKPAKQRQWLPATFGSLDAAG